MNSNLSRTLMISNFFCTVLVVAIHYNSKWCIDTANADNLNFYIQEFITNGIARSAVPFFALISGFFFFQQVKLRDISSLLIKKIQTLLIPYIIASIFILLCYDCLKYITNGSFQYVNDFHLLLAKIIVHPISIQFWFLRDLFFLFIFTPTLLVFSKNIKIIIVFITFILWIGDIQPFPLLDGWYFINSEVLFFFLLGGILCSPDKFEQILKLKKRLTISLIILWVSLIFLRIWIDPHLDVWYTEKYTTQSIFLYKLAIFFGVIVIIKLASIFIRSKFLIKISGLTFFVYLFHLKPLSLILYGITGFGEYSFYILFPMSTVVTFSTGYLIYKSKPPFYNLLTGGRSPDKSFHRTCFTRR